MAKTIMTANYKGGTGKTQTAIEMAYWLAQHGQRVLAIDLDHQANLTKVLSEDNPPQKRSLPDILIDGDTIKPEDISSRAIDENGNRVDYIATGFAAGRLEKKLPDDGPKEYVLKDALAEIQSRYDFILLDTPPSAELISTCALVASDYILITSQAALFSEDGVSEMMPVIRKIQRHPRLNPQLNVLGILITMYEDTLDSREALSNLQEEYGSLVLSQVIRKSTKVKESNRRFTSVQFYAPRSTIANDYKMAFKDIFKEITSKNNQ